MSGIVRHVFDRLTGDLLGVLVEIKGDQITYRPLSDRTTFHTISECWVMVWESRLP